MSSQVIGLVAHTGKAGAAELVRSLLAEFSMRNADCRLEARTAEIVGRESQLRTEDLGRECNVIVVLGGDGTMLQVVHDLGENLRPLFGINLGSLGFLTCVSSSAHREAAEAICSSSYVLSERAMLRVELERDGRSIMCRPGLNDVVISRGSLSRLIRLETRVNGKVLTEYNADGLIVATPTGSTAYSLAAGGPIVVPDSENFVITPISPHVLTNRSVIVSDTVQLEIVPVRDEPEVFLTVDGQELVQLRRDDLVRITKGLARLPLAMLRDTTFFELLQQKLKWSGSAV